MSWVVWLQQKLFPPDGDDASGGPSPGRPTRASRWNGALPAAPLPAQKQARPLHQMVGHLDRKELLRAQLPADERAALEELAECVVHQRLELHRLASTSSRALDMAASDTVDLRQMVEIVQRDPLLASELLRIANSAAYATDTPAANLQQAVMRVGLRAVRGVVFTAAMKSASTTSDALAPFADEVWRAARSAGLLARAIAVPLGFDSEQAYVLGLLHDLGKIALLSHLDRKHPDHAPTSAFVAQAFDAFHESAGGMMARAWKLPNELVAVASCHHDFRANDGYPRSAALASLAFEIDRSMSLGDEEALRALAAGDAFELLEINEDTRWEVLEHARHAWLAAEEALARR